jgi:membrane fusion protein, copper/silver efflux system
MKKAAYSILLFLLIAGAFLAGSWYRQRGDLKAVNPGSPEIVDHMDPTQSAHASHTPGIAPASGMSSGPVHVHGGPANPGATSASLSPGMVNITPEKQQLIGVRVSAVEKAPGAHALRLLGRVAPDEARVYRVNAGIEGFIREVSAATTGSQVKKDQLLATFSAPNSIQIIQQYILVLGAVDRVKQAITERSVEAQAAPLANSNYQQRVNQLQNLGMSVSQMEEIQRTREVPESIKILAPADGFVIARNVSPGLKFDRGAELYRIADLSRIWILADVFESEAHYLRPGVHAQVSLTSQRTTFPARVAEVLPQFDPITRTLKVRLEADNPGFVLRPDMFVDVELPITLPPTISVPVDAILDSGLQKTVFVDRGEGLFEPRQVETGWRFGNRVEVVKGLTAGERIVVSGTFLLDSESRMKAAGAGSGGTSSKGEAAHPGHAHGAHDHGGHQP